EHEPGREARRALAADDRDVAVFERLTQCVERVAVELAELVEEEHAVMGQRRLPRSRSAAAADEARGRDRVVRRAERPLADQPAAGCDAGDRLDARDLDRLLAA